MVAGSKKSNTFRKIHVTTPGGNRVIHYKKRKPSHPVCGECGARLLGVARNLPSKISRMSKTEKRPTRPYGGNLCSKCTRVKIKAQIE